MIRNRHLDCTVPEVELIRIRVVGSEDTGYYSYEMSTPVGDLPFDPQEWEWNGRNPTLIWQYSVKEGYKRAHALHPSTTVVKSRWKRDSPVSEHNLRRIPWTTYAHIMPTSYRALQWQIAHRCLPTPDWVTTRSNLEQKSYPPSVPTVDPAPNHEGRI